ncbi:hypothetical protein NDU88_012364 [Pleurodeles waltl]|uniref:Uncharacterized protein n=1 Tax=Pleurodeles waltl TaxID=8319 RepID=A0AAV7QZX5_PLEWA|nr:hypothetical protein NDU88_012364 [Pleurodeles waltl]
MRFTGRGWTACGGSKLAVEEGEGHFQGCSCLATKQGCGITSPGRTRPCGRKWFTCRWVRKERLEAWWGLKRGFRAKDQGEPPPGRDGDSEALAPSQLAALQRLPDLKMGSALGHASECDLQEIPALQGAMEAVAVLSQAQEASWRWTRPRKVSAGCAEPEGNGGNSRSHPGTKTVKHAEWARDARRKLDAPMPLEKVVE